MPSKSYNIIVKIPMPWLEHACLRQPCGRATVQRLVAMCLMHSISTGTNSGLVLCRFDGDGMVHACRIKGGKASYSNRLVQTHRLKREVKQGFPLYLRVRPSPACLSLLPGFNATSLWAETLACIWAWIASRMRV